MAYVEGRIVHDADTHVMEVQGFLDDFVESRFHPALMAAGLFDRRPGFRAKLPDLERRRENPQIRVGDRENILLRKNWEALGAFRREDRPAALDHLGFASQLVFTTQLLKYLADVEHGGDLDLTYAVAAAHNRYMAHFCAVDRRLLATGYVPLADVARSTAAARQAIDCGCKALMIASRCPAAHSPSHIGLDPVWAQAQEAGLPVVFHVGGGGTLLSPAYFVNGLPPVPDFHGGDDNFRSVDYLAIPYPPMQSLATMIIDGVLERFPRLKIGVIEQGASWLPGLMRMMDSAHMAFYKNEERLQQMS